MTVSLSVLKIYKIPLLVLDVEEIGVAPPGVGVCGLEGIGGNWGVPLPLMF
jgi:hypothetical protein